MYAMAVGITSDYLRQSLQTLSCSPILVLIDLGYGKWPLIIQKIHQLRKLLQSGLPILRVCSLDPTNHSETDAIADANQFKEKFEEAQKTNAGIIEGTDAKEEAKPDAKKDKSEEEKEKKDEKTE